MKKLVLRPSGTILVGVAAVSVVVVVVFASVVASVVVVVAYVVVVVEVVVVSITEIRITFEPPNDKTNNMVCSPSEDSDQAGHPPSSIRVLYSLCAQWVAQDPSSLHADR